MKYGSVTKERIDAIIKRGHEAKTTEEAHAVAGEIGRLIEDVKAELFPCEEKEGNTYGYC